MNVKHEQARKRRAAAMPDVKRLVKKYGRTTISACLQQLQNYEKQIKMLAAAKREVAVLEKALK